MAPRKPTTTAKPARKSPMSERDKVVKRPARGYHKYKNGLLNVTPKGGEKDLVKSNQNSPLLRLPPEIRNRIWEYTLGNTIFRARIIEFPSRVRRLTVKLQSPEDEPGIGVALLRSCRQIYSEAATMPLRLNTMACDSFSHLKSAMKDFKAFQRKQITTVRLELSGTFGRTRAENEFDDRGTLSKICPVLKHIQIVTFGIANGKEGLYLENLERRLRSCQFFVSNPATQLTVEGHDQFMPVSYYYSTALVERLSD